ncbi:hypothetical protein BDV40DRAFT_305749 [Aspergillus tamarii]|uniref:Uncharacterized protein n=1 Tax=Aspergillus tamarii TaxID=41984 RepID=A0A5N6UDU7_ASPTM|nr:hypothetical protein BDV40DRAFT_305749 [Aspergillus tamarii]
MVGASQPESKASGFDTEYGVDDVVATENAELKERYATTKADDGYPKGVQLALLLLVVFVMFQVALAPNLAAQTVLPTNDVPIGTSLMLFNQLSGGAVFISVGQNILGTQLFERLKSVTGFDVTLL